MAECENLPGCPFFHDQMDDMPAMAVIYKNKYCLGSNSSCARYWVYRRFGKGNVPSDLFPNDRERAEQLIAEADVAEARPSPG